MFLVEVVTGEFCQGNSSMAVIPNKPGQKEAYDSVVNNTHTPSVFVVFKDASVYPLYMLKY